MSREQIEQTVVAALSEVAPDVDASAMNPDQSFRDQVDFDSMDFLNLMLALDRAFGIHIAEVDYPRLSSLNGCVDYLERRLNTMQAAR